LLTVAFVDNYLILWSIKLKCLMDFGGAVAFPNQLPEMNEPHPEDMDARAVVENLPFILKVAI